MLENGFAAGYESMNEVADLREDLEKAIRETVSPTCRIDEQAEAKLARKIGELVIPKLPACDVNHAVLIELVIMKCTNENHGEEFITQLRNLVLDYFVWLRPDFRSSYDLPLDVWGRYNGAY